jgi:hypothetical protein
VRADLPLCRATVRRGYGRHIISDVEIEDPPRVSIEMSLLARGLLALGLQLDETERIVRKVALDSMPGIRLKLLTVLTKLAGAAPGDFYWGGPTTYRIAKMAGIHHRTAREQLEELEQAGVVEGHSAAKSKREALREADDQQNPNPEGLDERDERIMTWALTKDRGGLVRKIIEQHLAGGRDADIAA